ncbi:hypothetical protein BDY21DRAFT_418498 [Lineolata rhizophorae]|uniref:Uncharacterized protein n=1 Tax=Lineolata rhizophorae TaxID=578093 RepID=A0A6A6PBX6_9PEZI|nr:hypothetical protein BDY21DRAFT_418498 [Lineolata rhizophorae]
MPLSCLLILHTDLLLIAFTSSENASISSSPFRSSAFFWTTRTKRLARYSVIAWFDVLFHLALTLILALECVQREKIGRRVEVVGNCIVRELLLPTWGAVNTISPPRYSAVWKLQVLLKKLVWWTAFDTDLLYTASLFPGFSALLRIYPPYVRPMLAIWNGQRSTRYDSGCITSIACLCYGVEVVADDKWESARFSN